MKKIIFILAASCITFGFAKPMAHQLLKESDKIQVLLEKDVNEALIEVRGPYYVFNPYDGTRVSSGIINKRFLVHATKDGLKWGEKFPDIHQIYISPRSKNTSILVNGVQYDGGIAIFKNQDKISIINEIKIENYLKCILSEQFTLPLENEVMSAVAIAARTSAYYICEKNPTALWHVSANEVGYYGATQLIPHSPVVKAVDNTKNLVLVSDMNGKKAPFIATWNEHSAGKTASYPTIFRKDIETPDSSVEAPYANLDKEESKWSYMISKNELAMRLGIGNIETIDLFTDKISNKNYAIRINNGSDHQDYDFFAFQEKIGESNLLSNEFSISIKDNLVSFTGYGKGHGVGICLHSASSMAQNGEIAIDILNKFYPETQLINLSSELNESSRSIQ